MPTQPRSGASVCDCSDPAQKVALILYPSLGTPMLIGLGPLGIGWLLPIAKGCIPAKQAIERKGR